MNYPEWQKQQRRKEVLRTALIISAAVLFAGLLVWSACAKLDQCRADGFSQTECNALLYGNTGVSVGRR